MIRRNVLAIAVGGLVATAMPAIAHKLQYSTTDLLWRPSTGLLEIEHAIHLDDAMTLLAHLGDPQGELPLEVQAKLLLYVEENFSLTVADKVLELEPIGAKIEGDYLWIYQELQLPSLPKAIQVSLSLMQELFPRQTNQVNLRVGDTVRTLHFHRDQKLGVFTLLN